MSNNCNQTYYSSQRRGIALMLVMIAILVSGGMAVAYFGSRDNSIAISENINTASMARTSSESGLDLAIAILETDADWRTQHIEGVILNDFQFGNSLLTITVIDTQTSEPPTDSTNEVEITVHSSINGVSQTMLATATIIPQDDEFDVDFSEFAIFARSNIQVRDVATIGLWAASPLALKDNDVQIGTLSTRPMAIDLQSRKRGTQIEVHTVAQASSMVSPSKVNRKHFSDTPTLPSPPTKPTNGTPLEIHQALASNHNNWRQQWSQNFSRGNRFEQQRDSQIIVVSEGDYELDTLDLSNGQSIVIQGNVTINIQNDMSISNASIILDDDATLELYVSGNANIHSGYIGNRDQSVSSWMDPSSCQLYGLENASWNLDGNTTVKAELYAPDSEVSLQGNSTLCGRIAADEVELRGSSTILYDQTLDHGGYADEDSDLYDDLGYLVSGLRNLATLDPIQIDSIRNAVYKESSDDDDSFIGNHQWMTRNWKLEPTERPHEVIYVLKIYGIDARVWETRARALRPLNSNRYVGVLN